MPRTTEQKTDVSAEESGALFLEAAIYLPLLLVAFLGMCQLAHLAFAWEQVHYASFAAARSVLIANPDYMSRPNMNEEQAAALSAAARLCPFMSKDSSVRRDNEGRWRKGSTAVTVERPAENRDSRLVTVYMDIPLLFNLKMFSSTDSDSYIVSSDYDEPRLRLRECTLISKRVCPTTKNNLPPGCLN